MPTLTEVDVAGIVKSARMRAMSFQLRGKNSSTQKLLRDVADALTAQIARKDEALRDCISAMKKTWTIVKPFTAGAPTVSADEWTAACDQLDAALTKAKGEINV